MHIALLRKRDTYWAYSADTFRKYETVLVFSRQVAFFHMPVNQEPFILHVQCYTSQRHIELQHAG